MPDTSPCDMAIICRKPCFEVYHVSRVLFPKHFLIFLFFSNQIYIHRKIIFSDEEILENQQPPRKSAKMNFSKFKIFCIVIYISQFRCENFQTKTKISTHLYGKSGTYWKYHDVLTIPFFCPFRTLTCHHKGPCNQYTNCDCYNKQQRCQRMCSCSKDCKKRPP